MEGCVCGKNPTLLLEGNITHRGAYTFQFRFPYVDLLGLHWCHVDINVFIEIKADKLAVYKCVLPGEDEVS